MIIRRSLVVFLAVFCAAVSPLSAQLVEDQAVSLPSARTAAIGGVHAALADDLTSLFSNPAGFQSAGPQAGFAQITLGASGPVFSIMDFVMQIAGGADVSMMLLDPASPAAQLFTNLYAAGIMNGPLALGYVGNGFGIGFFNTAGVLFQTVGSIPTITAAVHEDLILCTGYAFRIPLPQASRMTLDLGFLLKTFATGSIQISGNILSLMSILSAPSAAVLTAQPFLLDAGAGLDLGIRYAWNSFIAVGIVGRNLPSYTMRFLYPSIDGFIAGAAPTVGFGYVPIDLSAGIELTPRLGFLESYITELKILLDYSDILDFLTHPDTATNPILHAGLGIEMTLLEILYLRGGLSHGYFSAGFGLDLTIFKLDIAMFGSELSREPGLRPVYNIMIGFLFTY